MLGSWGQFCLGHDDVMETGSMGMQPVQVAMSGRRTQMTISGQIAECFAMVTSRGRNFFARRLYGSRAGRRQPDRAPATDDFDAVGASRLGMSLPRAVDGELPVAAMLMAGKGHQGRLRAPRAYSGDWRATRHSKTCRIIASQRGCRWRLASLVLPSEPG